MVIFEICKGVWMVLVSFVGDVCFLETHLELLGGLHLESPGMR